MGKRLTVREQRIETAYAALMGPDCEDRTYWLEPEDARALAAEVVDALFGVQQPVTMLVPGTLGCKSWPDCPENA